MAGNSPTWKPQNMTIWQDIVSKPAAKIITCKEDTEEAELQENLTKAQYLAKRKGISSLGGYFL